MTNESEADVSRRGFLRGVAGTTVGAAAVAATPAAAQEERPDWGGWLDGVEGGYEDARGSEEVTVTVGAEGNQGPNAFEPAGLWVDPGTTVVFEWTGEGSHNVHGQEGPASDIQTDVIAEAGVHLEHEFTEDGAGITTYQCDPHVQLGMKGAVAVGDDVDTVDTGGGGDGGGGGGGGGPLLPDSAKTLGVAGAGAMASTLALAYAFVKYGGAGRAEG